MQPTSPVTTSQPVTIRPTVSSTQRLTPAPGCPNNCSEHGICHHPGVCICQKGIHSTTKPDDANSDANTVIVELCQTQSLLSFAKFFEGGNLHEDDYSIINKALKEGLCSVF